MTKLLAAVVLVLSCCGLPGAVHAQTGASRAAVRGLPGKPAATRTHASAQQVQDFLTANPDLRAGVNLPDGTTVKVQRTIPGGIRYRITGLPRGQGVMVDVTGPPSVLAKGFLETLWDDVKKVAAAVTQVLADVDAASGPGRHKQQGCININVNAGNNTVNISGGSDNRTGCGDIE